MIARLGRLREANVIRQISAIFDTRNLGYTSALVAMKIPAEQLSAGARVVNGFPGVSHNYKREADYNLWFTAAVRRVIRRLTRTGVRCQVSRSTSARIAVAPLARTAFRTALHT